MIKTAMFITTIFVSYLISPTAFAQSILVCEACTSNDMQTKAISNTPILSSGTSTSSYHVWDNDSGTIKRFDVTREQTVEIKWGMPTLVVNSTATEITPDPSLAAEFAHYNSLKVSGIISDVDYLTANPNSSILRRVVITGSCNDQNGCFISGTEQAVGSDFGVFTNWILNNLAYQQRSIYATFVIHHADLSVTVLSHQLGSTAFEVIGSFDNPSLLPGEYIESVDVEFHEETVEDDSNGDGTGPQTLGYTFNANFTIVSSGSRIVKRKTVTGYCDADGSNCSTTES